MQDNSLNRRRHLKSNIIHVNFDSSQDPRERWEAMLASDEVKYTVGYGGKLLKRLDPATEERLRNAPQ